ncbi:MAG: serine/threonine-protein phosphatase [bacterium]|nr:serine/threonine-protein phosphatase [bacterium]
MQIYYSSLSDVGNVRSRNEDSLYAGCLSEAHLFVVADGMGGHNSGDVASYRAVTGLVKGLKKGVEKDIPGTLEKIILQINGTLIQEGKKASNNKGMGTTVSTLYIKNEQGYIAHVGDSRIYRYSTAGSGAKLIQLTEDHSLVGKLFKEGFITKEEAQVHPKRNVLYQSVGLKEGITVQKIGPFPIREGEKYLLCSDGLNNEILDSEIEEYLKHKSTKGIVDGLVEKAKAGIAGDNVTIIVVSTEEDEAVRLGDKIEVELKKKEKK